LKCMIRDYKSYIKEFIEDKIFIEHLIDSGGMNYLYEDFGVGKRVVIEHANYVDVDKTLDKYYYLELDHLFICDLTTILNIEAQTIIHKYKIKDNYKHLSLNKNIKLEMIINDNEDSDNEEIYQDEEDTYGLPIEKEFSMEFHLTDWIIEKIDCHNIDEDQFDFLNDLIDSDYEMIDRDVECLKRYLFDLRSNLNVFYNCKENTDHYYNQ